MKLHTSGHYSDVLYLSWLDLLRLACGRCLWAGGFYVRVKANPNVAPTNEQRYSGIM